MLKAFASINIACNRQLRYQFPNRVLPQAGE